MARSFPNTRRSVPLTARRGLLNEWNGWESGSAARQRASRPSACIPTATHGRNAPAPPDTRNATRQRHRRPFPFNRQPTAAGPSKAGWSALLDCISRASRESHEFLSRRLHQFVKGNSLNDITRNTKRLVKATMLRKRLYALCKLRNVH